MGAYDDKSNKGSARKSGEGAAGYDAPFRGYINVNLTDEQKADYGAWAESDQVWVTLEASAADGVNLSLRIDPKSGGFLASATQRRAASPNAGLVVTARGRSAAVAWGRMLFILDLLHKYKKWEDLQPMADPDRW